MMPQNFIETKDPFREQVWNTLLRMKKRGFMLLKSNPRFCWKYTKKYLSLTCLYGVGDQLIGLGIFVIWSFNRIDRILCFIYLQRQLWWEGVGYNYTLDPKLFLTLITIAPTFLMDGRLLFGFSFFFFSE